mgnify:CR=1 FL=1
MNTIATVGFLVAAVLCAVVLVLAALAAAANAVTADRPGWAAMAAPFVLQLLAGAAGLAALLSVVLNVIRFAKGA